MFVRTRRLTLRPGWPEDAPELTRAIAHEAVVRNLSRAPWPYSLADAQAWLAQDRAADDLKFLICVHEAGAARVIGSIGIEATQDGTWELGYFLSPESWGRGYATEAGRGAIEAAQAIGVRCIGAGYYTDNPASGHVLEKLGFQPTGETRPTFSRGRGCDVACVRMAWTVANRAASAQLVAA